MHFSYAQKSIIPASGPFRNGRGAPNCGPFGTTDVTDGGARSV